MASRWRETTEQTRLAVRNWIAQSILGMAGYAAALFAVAGKLNWAWGWAWWATVCAFLAGHVVILLPLNPALLAEREKGLRDPAVKPWDRWIAALAGGAFPILALLTAALNQRFSWEPVMPLAAHVEGWAVMAAGYVLFLWAMASNAYFAEGVRVQAERGHRVADRGPYRLVRHPGYVGSILSLLGVPWLLGSRYALAPTLVAVALFALRTYLEDTTLQAELEGYRDYAQKVPYRLIPGLW